MNIVNSIIEIRKWRHSLTGYISLVVYTEIYVSRGYSLYQFEVISVLNDDFVSHVKKVSRYNPKHDLFVRDCMDLYINQNFIDWIEIHNDDISEDTVKSNDIFMELL